MSHVGSGLFFHMKRSTRLAFIIVCIFCCIISNAQKKYTVANAHSHNDYLNEKPFQLAFENGFGSIEADVFPVNGSLLVAHHKKDTQSQRSLKNLYIDPLLRSFDALGKRKLSLLVDIKEDYELSLALLAKELEPLKKYLSTPDQPNFISIVVSGARPSPAQYKNYPGYIFFDDDLKLPHNANEWSRVALVSLPFNKISGWDGKNDLKRKDRKVLAHIIDSVHTAGKPVRFWAAPDTETSWKWQMKLGTDLIGTDQINDLANFLRKKKIEQ